MELPVVLYSDTAPSDGIDGRLSPSFPESDPETRVESFDVDGKVPVTNELTVVDEGKVEDTRRGTYPTVEPFCPKRIS
ncbi:hypothetical protein OFM39_25350, partial [Escherichia coli]|nr:hypothetical protein [Escherichia coli]